MGRDGRRRRRSKSTMKRSQRKRLTRRPGDRIAHADSGDRLPHRLRQRVLATAAFLLLTGPHATAAANCPPGSEPNDSPVDPGCSAALPTATAAVHPAAVGNEAGMQELALAKEFLDRGESAPDDAGRRK